MPLTMGEKVKIILIRRNMTMSQLAEILGQSRQNISNKMSRDNFTEKELADGRYAELEKEYREALAVKEKLQDELTERRRRSLMIGWFIDEVSVFEYLFTEFSENLWLGLWM